jgi:long-chain acyl-CoA synthetase
MEPKYTIANIIKQLYTNYQNPRALNDYVDGQWVSTSSQQLLEIIEETTLGLVSLGVQKGQRIALLAFPSSYWTMIDIAIILSGAISVPIFPNISEENLVFQIEQSDARLLFLGENIGSLYQDHKNLFNEVICIRENSREENELSLTRLCEMGREYRSKNPDAYNQLFAAARPEDIATIIYTSGTTGIPKGAELNNHNLASLISFKGFGWIPDKDRYLSVIPLAHIFGRVMNVCLFAWSVSIYYLNDAKQMSEACQLAHPTIFVVVPRLLEKVYAKMLAKVDSAGFLKRTMGHWAFDLANNEHDDSLIKQVLHPIADKVVYSVLREAFGGSARILISGGAPLNPHLAHFYIDIGLQIYEGWGMTEATPVCVNRPGYRKVGTVGPPLDGMIIKVSQEGEVLVKGDVVMQRYHNNEEATKQAFDEEGWLKTGDKGVIDQDGYLTIVGRLKELLKTSTGEYVVPVPIEQKLSKIPLVDLSVVIAERHKYTTCLIFPDFDVLHKLKVSKGQEAMDDDEFLKSPAVRDEMQKAIDEINNSLNKAEKIQNFCFVPHAPSVEKGDLTPSLKIRRDTVEKKYSELINGMYPKEAI